MIGRLAWWLWFALCAAAGIGLLLLMFRALDGSSFLFCVGCSESLDQAQQEFEERERAKHYDFDAWRKAGDMRCWSGQSLRVCHANPVVIGDRYDNSYQPVRDFVSFACTATECAWVQP